MRLEHADKLADAADALWAAHCKSHDSREPPLKWAMNYGELVRLKEAVDAYRAASPATGPATVEPGRK